jgi:hypothetical protein
MSLEGRTTMADLTVLSRLLASHPSALSTLRAEIAEVCGTNDTPPSRSQLKRMHYLDAVVKEGKPLSPVLLSSLS